MLTQLSKSTLGTMKIQLHRITEQAAFTPPSIEETLYLKMDPMDQYQTVKLLESDTCMITAKAHLCHPDYLSQYLSTLILLKQVAG